MHRFNCVVEEIRNQADQIKGKLLEKIGEGEAVIFGAGDCGHRIYDLLRGYHIQVSCFCDNGMGGCIDEKTGLKIIRPAEVQDTVAHPEILICVEDRNIQQEIVRQLSLLGFENPQMHIMNEYFYLQAIEYLDVHLDEYRKAYQFMEDEFSRQTYLEKMKKVFLLSDISQIVRPCEEEYFDEKVPLTEDEVFVDCGGFDGDSALHFIKQCGGRYRDVIIFEPEFSKREVIEKNMGNNRYQLFQLGVWSKSTKLYFNAMGTVSSRISDRRGEYMIETVALDEVVYDKEPTYIKMDVEGAEQEALKGCRKIIQTYKPKLAICIYHRPDDLYKIPIMIKEMNPEYKLYVRQYANAWYDTVLYAVPFSHAPLA